MTIKGYLRDDIEHVLLCASDLVRTSRGSLSDACTDTLGWDFYWPCRRVLEFLESQLGYEIWTEWGDEIDELERRPGAMTYADCLLEAAALVVDCWEEIVDSIRMESNAIRSLRHEVRRLWDSIEELREARGLDDDSKWSLYRGIFA